MIENGARPQQLRTEIREFFKRDSQRLNLRVDLLNIFETLDQQFSQLDQISETLNPAVFFEKLEEIYFALQVLMKKLSGVTGESEFITRESLSPLSFEVESLGRYVESVYVDLARGTQVEGLRARLISSLKSVSESPLKDKRMALDYVNLDADVLSQMSVGERAQRDELLEGLLKKGISHPMLPSPLNFPNSAVLTETDAKSGLSLFAREYLSGALPWALEMLNFKLFSCQEYFVYGPWKENFKTKLSETQTSKSAEKLILTDFTLVPRMVIPDVSGRDVFKSVGVSMNWPDLVYISSTEKKQQALEWDQRTYQTQQESELCKSDRFSLGLMNMLWDLKLSRNPGLDLLRVLSCGFWARVPGLDLDIGLESVELEVEGYNEALYDSVATLDVYSSRFERVRVLKRELDHWQDLVNVRIPDLYAKSEDEFSKLEIQSFWDFAKREYAEKLRFYKNNFVRKNSFFVSNKIRDLERELVSDVDKEYKRKERAIGLEDRLLQTEEEVRQFAQNNLMKMAIYVAAKNADVEGRVV